ncbi:biotin transporter BioY [Paracoccus salsus]|uniref:biotin transporter BioY n=1 Tax=Paracoccus salsus TaxID=2911061 RepID=UPI001F243AE3|nr:biotin transporter BioY [Paracoccus salsus]MCF3972152.1 biotin transporter BioY [Paracoccus salsus]
MQHINRLTLAVSPVRAIGLTLAAAALITLSAKTQVPFWPVPMTLQTMAVLLIATVLGPRVGAAAMLTYLAAGMAGMPVFAGSPERGIGLAYLAGPTGGFLVGMLLAMIVTGWLAQGRDMPGRVLAMLAGLAAIYLPGLAWLSGFVPGDKLLAAGFAPFILGDLFKIAIAALLIEGGLRLRAARR